MCFANGMLKILYFCTDLWKFGKLLVFILSGSEKGVDHYFILRRLMPITPSSHGLMRQFTYSTSIAHAVAYVSLMIVTHVASKCGILNLDKRITEMSSLEAMLVTSSYCAIN